MVKIANMFSKVMGIYKLLLVPVVIFTLTIITIVSRSLHSAFADQPHGHYTTVL